MEDDNRYVIIAEAGKQYYALTHTDNTIGIVQVTISNDEIVSEVTEDMVWIYSDNKLSYEDKEEEEIYYMAVLVAATNNTQPGGAKKPGAAAASLILSTTEAANVSIDKNKIQLDSYYLHFNKDKVKVENKGSNTLFFCES